MLHIPTLKTMIKNYLKITLRSLWRQRFFTFVNAFGLSIALAFCTLIYLFILDESRFDKFHSNKKDIFRMNEVSYLYENNSSFYVGGAQAESVRKSAWLPAALGPTLKDEMAEVIRATRFNEGSVVLKHNEKIFKEDMAFVDADFFKMFSFKVLSGNPDHFFDLNEEIVLTESIARKYFGNDDPVNQTIIVRIGSEEKSLTITGVLADPPSYSSLEFGVLIPSPNRSYYERNMQNWNSFNSPTFVQLSPNVISKNFEANLRVFTKKYFQGQIEYWRERQKIPEGEPDFELGFTNLADIHLTTDVNWNKVSDPKYAYILGGIAVLILIIACINYVSLSLSRSIKRRLEVGIRKVSGAQKGQLISQFLFESMLQSFVAMVIAVALIHTFLPWFNDYTLKGISLGLKEWATPGIFIFILSIATGILAGSYPSFFLSKQKPISVLKKEVAKVRSRFSTFLVGLQFFLSGGLIICSVIMFKQMNFITQKDLGYNEEQVVVIPTYTGWTDEGEETVKRFRHRFAGDPDIIGVSGTSASFNRGWSRNGYKVNGEQKAAFVYRVDEEYIKLLDIELIAGRNFDPAIPSDKNSLIINEALAKDMGYDDPLAERLDWHEDSVGYQIIGVVKDYNFLSLEHEIDPMFIMINPEDDKISTMLVKLAPGKIGEGLSKLQTGWNELVSDKPFDYSFLDEDVARQYESYSKWTKITGLSTFFAILIASLGLFGLAGINASNRTKEIGIRKVLGAGVSHILFLMTRHYVVLSLIAFAISAPLSWYIMEKWLSDFEYTISLSWELFVIAMAGGLLITLLTVSYHSIKSTIVNPADTLRYE